MIPEEYKKARRKAMLLLEHMDRTEKSLSERLRQAGFSQEAIQDAMEYVKSYGYIDDFRYAQNYISFRIHNRSRQKILMELQQKGVSREIALDAWEEVAGYEEPDEYRMLLDTIRKKHSEDTLLEEKELRRLVGFLIRRGFRQSDVYRALEELHIQQIKQYEESFF